MKKFLIIPDKDNFRRDMELVNKFNLGIEYNDFFKPCVMDDEYKLKELVEFYMMNS